MIVSVNQDLCKACGICGHVCPRHIPETIEKQNKKLTMISHERYNPLHTSEEDNNSEDAGDACFIGTSAYEWRGDIVD